MTFFSSLLHHQLNVPLYVLGATSWIAYAARPGWWTHRVGIPVGCFLLCLGATGLSWDDYLELIRGSQSFASKGDAALGCRSAGAGAMAWVSWGLFLISILAPEIWRRRRPDAAAIGMGLLALGFMSSANLLWCFDPTEACEKAVPTVFMTVQIATVSLVIGRSHIFEAFVWGPLRLVLEVGLVQRAGKRSSNMSIVSAGPVGASSPAVPGQLIGQIGDLYGSGLVPTSVLNLAQRTEWMNTGLWRHVNGLGEWIEDIGATRTWDGVPAEHWHYADAAEELARVIGVAADLNEEDQVLDVGFGNGDEILLWKREFGVKKLTGVELSGDCVKRAKQKTGGLIPVPFLMASSGLAVRGSFSAGTFSKIICVDCAHHLAPREKWLRDAAELTRRGGRLVMSDWVVKDGCKPPTDFFEKAGKGFVVSSLFAQASLLTCREYRSMMEGCGWERVSLSPGLKQGTVGGLVSWIERNAGVSELIRREAWTGLEVMKEVGREALQSEWLEQVLIIAQKL